MPISGLVVTLDADPELGRRARAEISQHPHMDTGEAVGRRLPLVVDTPDRQTDKQCWRWLNELPGVYFVDVAFIHFEDADGCRTARPTAADLPVTLTTPTTPAGR